MLRLKSRILAGLVLVVPIWITFVIIAFIFRLMRDASYWLIEAVFLSSIGHSLLSEWGLEPGVSIENGLKGLPMTIRWTISLISVILTIAALFVLGAVTTNVVGKRIVRSIESLVDRVPIATMVYNASKKVVEAFAGGDARPFRQVVLIPFPTKETYSVGFVTHTDTDSRSKEVLYTVFLATAPNPTTGFVFVIRASDVVEVDWSIEDAIKVIMSGGMLMPDGICLESAVRR